jgi:hypothetical protein
MENRTEQKLSKQKFDSSQARKARQGKERQVKIGKREFHTLAPFDPNDVISAISASHLKQNDFSTELFAMLPNILLAGFFEMVFNALIASTEPPQLNQAK